MSKMADHINGMKKKGALKSDKWEQGAVKHPGSFTKAAKAKGESVHQLAEADKSKGGTIGRRARLALIFERQARKK